MTAQVDGYLIASIPAIFMIVLEGLEMSKVVQVTPRTIDEIKEYHLKRLYELSLKSIGKSTELEELTDEQKQWVKNHGF